MSNIPEVVDAVVVCMYKHDSNPKVFSKGCAVLWKMAHEEAAVKVCDSILYSKGVTLAVSKIKLCTCTSPTFHTQLQLLRSA